MADKEVLELANAPRNNNPLSERLGNKILAARAAEGARFVAKGINNGKEFAVSGTSQDSIDTVVFIGRENSMGDKENATFKVHPPFMVELDKNGNLTPKSASLANRLAISGPGSTVDGPVKGGWLGSSTKPLKATPAGVEKISFLAQPSELQLALEQAGKDPVREQIAALSAKRVNSALFTPSKPRDPSVTV